MDLSSLASLAARANFIRLFLDYDGTLADFAPSPDDVLPDEELITLFKDLVSSPNVHPAIVSGRRLSHIQELLPVNGLLLGGTYGIEMQLPDGTFQSAFPIEKLRPTVELLIPRWKLLIQSKNGFHLEDKGWGLALHALRAGQEDADQVIPAALKVVSTEITDPNFRVIQGYRFLEYAPVMANKVLAVRRIMKEMTPEDALIIYIGDDDKDEEAMGAVIDAGGYGIKVTADPDKTRAQFTLQNPLEVRIWLRLFHSECNALNGNMEPDLP